MQACRRATSVSPLNLSWQRIAERLLQRSSDRTHASIVRRSARGSPKDPEDLAAERLGIVDVEPRDGATTDRAQRHRPDTVEGHRRPHVGLRAAGALRVAADGELPAESEEKAGRARHGAILPRLAPGPSAARHFLRQPLTTAKPGHTVLVL